MLEILLTNFSFFFSFFLYKKSNAPGSISAAKSAGISTIDVYLFPCAGQSASTQVTSMISFLQAKGASYGTIWLDIETNPSTNCGWSSNTQTNCQFISDLIQAAGSHPVGVYASSSMWSEIAGSSCTVGSSKPLWYAHYDNNVSLSFFFSSSTLVPETPAIFLFFFFLLLSLILFSSFVFFFFFLSPSYPSCFLPP
jgi:hypothetical protein